MLARGPAGFRFTAKALQHAMPDAKLERGEIATDGDPSTIAIELWLSGKLRGTGEAVNTVVADHAAARGGRVTSRSPRRRSMRRVARPDPRQARLRP